jgi:Grx4 family monothiol glutaredoxin
MSTVQEIRSDEEYQTLFSSLPKTHLVIISFYAPWAAPCAQMSELFKALAAGYKPTSPPSISFLSIDAEELPDISEAFDVTAVPFLVLSLGGEVIETVSGSDAGKVRDAVERGVKRQAQLSGSSAYTIPPAQQASKSGDIEPAFSIPQPQTGTAAPPATNGNSAPTGPAKNLAAYAAKPADKETPKTTSPEELHTRLTTLVKAAPVMLFMKGTPSAPECGFSRTLVGLLRQHQIKYGFFNILADDEVRQGLKTFADWPTFPQLWAGGELIGGLDIVSTNLS